MIKPPTFTVPIKECQICNEPVSNGEILEFVLIVDNYKHICKFCKKLVNEQKDV